MMKSPTYTEAQLQRDIELSAQAESVTFHFQPSRREFVQVLGAGLVIAVAATRGAAQEEPRRGGGGGGGRGRAGGIGGTPPANIAARLHIAKDGAITLLCGKIECGQGARTEVSQAAAEELVVPLDRITALLGDTSLVPDDGPTVGSATTPRTIPAVRQACATARDLLIALACRQLNLKPEDVTLSDGRVFQSNANRSHAISYADLAAAQDLEQLFAQSQVSRDATLRAVKQWKVLGVLAARPNGRDIVTGRHPYPSDVVRPGMLYGKVLRAPTYRATLSSFDAASVQKMPGVTVVREGDFAGVAAANSYLAQQAVERLAQDCRWESEPGQPSSDGLDRYLVEHARNLPANPFGDELKAAAKTVKQSYFIPYVQHCPLEPRAAVAEWDAEGKLTVWTGSQNPFAVRRELATAFRLPPEQVRVIINDFGSGYGGKHTGECAVEAARLAKGCGKPVSLRWTREEEFTWAYFRPAGVMQGEASLDANGRITSWHFLNINSGPNAVQTPYAIARNHCQFVPSQPPLRHGSYRGLAATANAFGRECFMDELADAAGRDPLEFRLAHLTDERLAAVLKTVAERFDWAGRSKKKEAGVGIGIACATEKGSYVATAAQVAVDRDNNTFTIQHLAEVFECGAILNPDGLLNQVQGNMIQGLGPALREEMVFKDGRVQNASFGEYAVPRFGDVPPMDIFLLNRPDLASAGAGETPLITVAPAIANALSRAGGARQRRLPLRLA